VVGSLPRNVVKRYLVMACTSRVRHRSACGKSRQGGYAAQMKHLEDDCPQTSTLCPEDNFANVPNRLGYTPMPLGSVIAGQIDIIPQNWSMDCDIPPATTDARHGYKPRSFLDGQDSTSFVEYGARVSLGS